MKNVFGMFLIALLSLTISCKSSQTTTSDMKGTDSSALAALATELGLESSVRSKFISIVEKYDKKFMSVHNKPQEGDQEATLQKATELRIAQSQELRAILSQDQMAAFSEWRQEQQSKILEENRKRRG